MINVERYNSELMYITVEGNAEDLAREYVALSLKVKDFCPIILDRAIWYSEKLEGGNND